MKNKKSESRKLVYPKLFSILSISALLFVCTTLAEAQNKWGLTFRTSANLPTNDLGDANIKTGLGLEGTIDYRLLPSLAIYAGWGWNRFSADDSFAGSNMDFEETGYRYGLQFIQPIGATKLSYSISAGGLYNHIETEDTSGEIISDSGHGFGWEAEAGIHIPLSERFSLIPSVRYHALSREIEIGNTTTDVDLNYLSIAAGLRWSF
jgi:opacity protein-like surface antigen